jgi:hypothetical protein
MDESNAAEACPQGLVPLDVAARRIFKRVYLPFHHPQAGPAPDQLNGLASAICGLAPVYVLDERGGAKRRLSADDLSGGLFRGGARELGFLDGRESIRNLAVSGAEVERAARMLHDAISG